LLLVVGVLVFCLITCCWVYYLVVVGVEVLGFLLLLYGAGVSSFWVGMGGVILLREVTLFSGREKCWEQHPCCVGCSLGGKLL
jgi:hypothetical protein